jgi:type II secretory pathway component GspD/PulD (secretin)
MVLPKIGQGLGMAFDTGGIKQGDMNTGDIKGGKITFKRGNELTDLQIKDSVFNFLRQYGKVRVVASPKLRVTNGHSALVVMGEVRPYWKANKTVTDTDTNSTTTEYEENKYLKGTLLGIVAKATNDDTIYLQVTPMLSDILEEKTSSDGTQSAPVISMREASTLLKLHNNSIAILGGLKGKKTAHREAGTPYLMDTPGVGLLFKDKLKYEETSEIAMIIRARVVY